jgi:Na+-driven multidrug efflux pump
VIILYLLSAYILADRLRLAVHFVWMSEFFYAFLLGTLSYLYLKTGKWKMAGV